MWLPQPSVERTEVPFRQAWCVAGAALYGDAHTNLTAWTVSAFTNNAHAMVPAMHQLLVAFHALAIGNLGTAHGRHASMSSVEGWERQFLKCSSFNVLRLQQKGAAIPLRSATGQGPARIDLLDGALTLSTEVAP